MWDPTPAHMTPGHATPGIESRGASIRRNRWDETPKTERETPGHNSGWAETPKVMREAADIIQETPTPSASKRKSRWDETPAVAMTPQTPATPMTPHTPSMMTPSGVTPVGSKAMAMATPSPSKNSNEDRLAVLIAFHVLEGVLNWIINFWYCRSALADDSRTITSISLGERNRRKKSPIV